jgi:arginase
MTKDKFYLLGYACGVAGADVRVAKGPLCIQQSPFLLALKEQGYDYQWAGMIEVDGLLSVSSTPSTPSTPSSPSMSSTPSFLPASSMPILNVTQQACTELAAGVSGLIRKQQAFTVIGGDHTAAIGTWSGAYDALHDKGEIGLIWIDAHMDSHTPATSESGRLHGMPAACLLGKGDALLTSILHPQAKIKPENMCFIGTRSYEDGEAELLARLNVRIYFMEEVKERGFVAVLKEAVKHVTRHTIAYGISLDVDGIDPREAPGVDVPQANGIKVKDLLMGLNEIKSDPKLIGTEIVEFDPSRDKEQKTEKIVVSLLEAIHKKD